MIEAFERIIISNSKHSNSPNPERRFTAVAELYKYLRGDPRVFQFYEARKDQMVAYAIDWLFGSAIDNHRKLALSFVTFILRFFPNIEYADFVGRDIVPDGFRMKF